MNEKFTKSLKNDKKNEKKTKIKEILSDFCKIE